MAMAFVLLLPLEHRRLRWWDDRIAAGGGRATAIGVLVCAAGLAILLMAKQSLGTETGWWALLGFLVALSSARALASDTMEEQLVPMTREYEEPLARESSAESSTVPAE